MAATEGATCNIPVRLLRNDVMERQLLSGMKIATSLRLLQRVAEIQ